MKLSKDYEDFLVDFLNKHLIYRETLNELHDHILSSLENYPEGESFETALQNILTRQFGGVIGLKNIERQYRKQTLSQMPTRYFNHILDLFISPSIILIGIATFAFWLFFSQVSFSRSIYIPVCLTLLMIPSIINGLRYFKAGYFFGSTKRSVSDSGFRLFKNCTWLICICHRIVSSYVFK